MTTKMLLNTLKTANPNAHIALGDPFGYRVTSFTALLGPGEGEARIQLSTDEGNDNAPASVGEMVKQLECLPDLGIDLGTARVYAGDEEILFVCVPVKEGYSLICLERAEDIDLAEEMDARFEGALKNGIDELDVYMDMLDIGITPEVVAKHCGIHEAAAMVDFCEDHGLI